MRLQRRLRRIVSLLLKLVLIALVLSCAASAYFLWRWDGAKAKLPVPDHERGNVLDPIGDDLVFALAGINLSGGDPSQTDLLLVVRMDERSGRVSVLAVPEDTLCEINGKPAAIGMSYAGRGIDGTVRALRDMTGLDIDYYVEVGGDAVKAFVDAAGGVELRVPDGVDGVSERIAFKPGLTRLGGKEAIAYFSIIQKEAGGSPERGLKLETELVRSALAQTLPPKELWRIPLMAKALMDHAKTNIPVLTNLPFFVSAGKLSFEKGRFEILPGSRKVVGGTRYYVPDDSKKSEILRELFTK